MLAKPLYQKLLSNAFQGLHKGRINTLLLLSDALMRKGKLSLTSLGRCLAGDVDVKHKIKRADYFLGNPFIYRDSALIYQRLSGLLLANLVEVRIAVDWSGCCNDENYLLRASILYKGRSLPVYQEVHPATKCVNPIVHAIFLDNLKKVISASCKTVIVVTDAGFGTPWFKQICALGWHYVGRIRGRIKYRAEGAEDWHAVKQVAVPEEEKVTDYGRIYLGKTRTTQCECRLISCKEIGKGRKAYKKKGLPFYPDKQKQYGKMNSEPWIIATSLSADNKSAKEIVYLYKKRMQIEQNFRDDKSHQFGFGWRYSRTKDRMRVAILCLISAVATFLLWLIGLTAEHHKLQYGFQANTYRHKRVLSFLFLAKEILFHMPYAIKLRHLKETIERFQHNYLQSLGEFL